MRNWKMNRIKNIEWQKIYSYLQNEEVNLVLMCCGIDSNPLFSIDLDNNGAGKQPMLGNPSVSENGNIDCV